MAFKTREKLEEFKSTLPSQSDTQLQEENEASIWSVENLKKLSVEEIEDRLWAVEEQSVLIKWRLWWALRQKFGKNDKAFGQHINEMREHSTRPGWPTSPRDITRSVACGRFCEKHNISDLTGIKIHQGAIEALSSIEDKKITTDILRQIRRKYVAVGDVKKMIMNATQVVSIVEKEPETTELSVIDYTSALPGKYTVEIERSIIVGEINGEPVKTIQQIAIIPPGREIEVDIEVPEKALIELKPFINDDLFSTRRAHSLRELASMDAGDISDDDAVQEVLLFIKQYKRPDMLKNMGFLKSIINAIQAKIKDIQDKSYNK